MDRLRLPFFIFAGWVMALVILVELAASELLTRWSGDRLETQTPGLAINYLAIIDGLLLYTVIIMGLGLIAPRGIVGRVQGIATLILSFFGLLGTIVLAFAAFGLLMLMVTLLVAVPFGTIAYIAGFGSFATGAAGATLLLIMALKVAFCVLLILAHQGFLKNKGIVILTAASMGLTWVVGFLHALPPRFLVSILDAVGALVIAIVGAVWLLVLLVGSILATISALRSVRRV